MRHQRQLQEPLLNLLISLDPKTRSRAVGVTWAPYPTFLLPCPVGPDPLLTARSILELPSWALSIMNAGSGFFKSPFTNWAFKSILTVLFIFKTPIPGMVGALNRHAWIRPFSPILSTPYRFVLPSNSPQSIQGQKPEFSASFATDPWSWSTTAPQLVSSSWVVTSHLLPLPRLTASTWPQGYLVFYCPDPWQGHRAGQGNKGGWGRQWILFLFFFFKKNTVCFRFMETLKVLHLLFVQSFFSQKGNTTAWQLIPRLHKGQVTDYVLFIEILNLILRRRSLERDQKRHNPAFQPS